MANVRETQSKLVYALLQLAVRGAAHFRIPMRTMSELLQRTYYETLRQQGLSRREIGRRLAQTYNHMTSIERKLSSDLLATERDIGVVRAVEAIVAAQTPLEKELPELLPLLAAQDVERAVKELLEEKRIRREEDGRLQIGTRYMLLASDRFEQRIDVLDRLLAGLHQAAMHRLVYDDGQTSMLKTITFSASPEALEALIARFVVELRRELAALNADAQSEGVTQRFTFGIALAPAADAHLARPG